MGFATHLGPWLLGTVKNTTGTTAGTIRNMGTTQVVQTNTLTFTDINNSLTGTSFVIPAGAILHSLTFFTTATFSSATTVKLSLGGVDLVDATTVTGPAVPTNMTSRASPTNAATSLWANVGTTDAIITYTATGSALTTGSVTLVCVYALRDSDGNANPSQV